ncbi:MAG: flavin reductase family protein, partial [Coriobacteriia bacterium]|nr:flavin reductase family protein [Coriobacteriia bacterium]
MKKRLGPSERIYPMPSPLVVGGDAERCGAMPVAWIGVASATPPSVSMALRKTRHTLELIRLTGTFTVNLPSTDLATQVDYCGITTGRGCDKIADAGLTTSPSARVDAPIINECPYNMECRVTHEIEIGEYVLVIGEVLETHAEERILDETGKKVDV